MDDPEEQSVQVLLPADGLIHLNDGHHLLEPAGIIPLLHKPMDTLPPIGSSPVILQ